jgi:hypothetical protein
MLANHSSDDIENMTKKQLKTVLQTLDLPCSGNAATLKERYKKYLINPGSFQNKRENNKKGSCYNRKTNLAKLNLVRNEKKRKWSS